MAHLSEKAKELRNKYKAKYGYFPRVWCFLMTNLKIKELVNYRL